MGAAKPGGSGDSDAVRSDPVADRNLEIELKLTGPDSVLEDLMATAVSVRSKATSRHMVSTYFDTADLRLRSHGVTLRVRQIGDRYEQTLKAEKPKFDGMSRRGEWSCEIAGPIPDLSRLRGTDALKKLGPIDPKALQPVFTSEIRRRVKTYRVNRKGIGKAHIEVAWDHGEIRCGGKSEPVCELELELLDGSPAVLQQEATRLHGKAPLQYQPQSKSERGYALALDGRPEAVKAVQPKLKPKMSVDQGLSRIFASCVGHWLANHAAVLDGTDTEGVHQMRVALRRLRSALTLFKGALPADDRDWLAAEAKALIGALGDARDWDVFHDELLAPVLSARPGDAELQILQQVVHRERRQAYEHAWAVLRSPNYLKFVLDLGIWMEDCGWRRPEFRADLDRSLADHAGTVLSKRYKASMKLGRDFDGLADEALHELRISLKKLRYASEFFAPLYDKKRCKPYLTTLRQLQDDLGHLNDVAVAEAKLGDLCTGDVGVHGDALNMASGIVIGWYSHVLDETRPRIGKDWRAFTETRTFWK